VHVVLTTGTTTGKQKPGRREQMITYSLSSFVQDMTANGRMTCADIRRLRNDVLPDGIATTQEAELLIGLDRKLAKAEPAWIEFLVGAIVNFAVWGTRPTGYVDAQTGTWLAGVLYRDGSARTALRIVAAIQAEAQDVAPELLAVGAGLAPRQPVADYAVAA
jgi:hypothetical protein